ncbi:MAG: helix-turn-helix domain-containing protein [Acidobacteriaceae bacterium]|nr:helix-turn-helix domain-containing protein [Acidobacteriaceae bacterium]
MGRRRYQQHEAHTNLTPPEAARELRCAVEKIHGWIRSGALKAINVATCLGGQPRWVIERKHLDEFKAARSNATLPPPRSRQPRQPRSRFAGTAFYGPEGKLASASRT